MQTPNLCTRLWLDVDIVPIVFNIKPHHTESVTKPNIKHRVSAAANSNTFSAIQSELQSGTETPIASFENTQAANSGIDSEVVHKFGILRTLDEQADSAARKCLMYYGPNNSPRLMIGPRNQVAVDAGGKIHLIDDLREYEKTVGKGTWNAVLKLADELREKKVKIGFFSSTPQGGELFKLLSYDTDVSWIRFIRRRRSRGYPYHSTMGTRVLLLLLIISIADEARPHPLLHGSRRRCCLVSI